MDLMLILGIILIISALSSKMSNRVGLPMLVGFILIGILIGNWFSLEDTATVGLISDFCLLLIIFTGGFQTNFAEAKPVLFLASVLSGAGTILTALLAGAFAYFALHLEFYQAMLLGAVISSTDAASVFSVLRSKQMDLKNNLGPTLEIESGSNDPFAHMLTAVLLSLATGGSQSVFSLLLWQICIGVLSGVLLAKAGQYLLGNLNVDSDSIYGVLLFGTAMLIYGAANQLGGNGFLAVYIGGMILGNSKMVYKGFLMRLYSSFSMLTQITLFIVLGMLCIPQSIASVIGSGLLFALVLFFVIRPLVVLVLMKPFGRPMNEIGLVSWAGFRGASSIVFATHVLNSGLPYAEHVFSLVFFVCMLSVIIQGGFIVSIAKRLNLVDE